MFISPKPLQALRGSILNNLQKSCFFSHFWILYGGAIMDEEFADYVNI